jgi:hypothetical protein
MPEAVPWPMRVLAVRHEVTHQASEFSGHALAREWSSIAGTLRAGQFARRLSPGEPTSCATNSFIAQAAAHPAQQPYRLFSSAVAGSAA